MSDEGGGPAPDFSGWEPVIDAALELAGSYPEQYRVVILETLLRTTDRGPAPTAPSSADGRRSREAEEEAGPGLDAVAKAADAAGVDPDALATFVHVQEDGRFRLLFPAFGGDSKAERANRTAAVYVFIKHHAFGEMDVGIEELRHAVKEQKAYDGPNFTRNFRNYPWLLEIGKTGSPKKKYRLSPEGQQAARDILRELLDAE